MADRMSVITMTTNDTTNVIERKDGKVICTEHGDEEVDMYCRRCGVLVCKKCIELRHRLHDKISIKSQAADDKKTLTRMIPGIKQNLIPSLRENLKAIKESRDSTKAEFSRLIEQINARSLELIKEINIVRDQMIQECKSNQEKTFAFLNETESKIQSGITTLEKKLKSCEDVLRHDRSSRNAEVILERIELDSNLDDFPNKNPKLEYPTFHPGLLKENQLKEIYGDFYGNFKLDLHTAIPFKNFTAIIRKAKPNVVSSFKYKTEIRAMCLADSNSAWLVPISQNNELVRVDRAGRELERRHVEFPVYDITLNQNKELLATNAERTSLMLLMTDGGQQKLADLPLRPRGLFACKNGDTLLCLCDAIDFPVHKDSKRKVVRMDKKYRIKLTIESYDNGRGFTLPDRVVENVNSDICVIDRTGGGNSHLCVFSRKGKFLFSYPTDTLEIQEQTLPSKILKKPSFRDVCCDSSGNIIVSDEKSNEIIVLSNHGSRKCLLTHRLQRSGSNQSPQFYRPSYLALDNEGKLWVLQKQGITIIDLHSQVTQQPKTTANTPR